MRLLLLIALFTPCLAAQDTEPLSGSVPENRRLTWLLRADFGGAVTAFSIAANINTPSSQGLVVRLLDLDTLSGSGALNPPGFDEAVVPGAGTANASLSGSYSGLHEFVVEIESAGLGSSFSGSVTSSAGTLDLVAQDQLVLNATGLRTTVSRLGFFNTSVNPGATVATGFQLDLGPVSRTVFVRFECDGTNLDRIELIDNTGGSATVLATLTSFPDAVSVPVTGSGLRSMRVNMRAATGLAASAGWSATVPTGVVLSRAEAGGGGDDDDDGCAAGNGGTAPAVLLCIAALVAAASRRPRRPCR